VLIGSFEEYAEFLSQYDRPYAYPMFFDGRPLR